MMLQWKKIKRQILLQLVLVISLLALVACGGGGGGSSDNIDSLEPVANPGPDQFVKTGDTVQLDGSGSLNPSGQPLTYAWLFTSKPVASVAELSNASAVNPTFVADKPGNYQLRLTVDDGLFADESAPVTISATTPEENAPPVADAGSYPPVATGSTVVLDGSKSSDADGDAITYSWNFDSEPDGSSSAFLPNNSVEGPSFLASHVGVYVVRLTVSDGKDSSEDTANITVFAPTPGNSPPVAVASISNIEPIAVGEIVALDGSGSTDPESDDLSYSWSLVPPTGSSAALSGSDGANPTFTPDRAGTYEVTLTVSDSEFEDSETVSVEVSYDPLFLMEGQIIGDVGEGEFYNLGVIFSAELTNNSSFNFHITRAELYNGTNSMGFEDLDKAFPSGGFEPGSFIVGEGDEIRISDGVSFWFHLERTDPLEEGIIIKYFYKN